jgi:hypothetical protein
MTPRKKRFCFLPLIAQCERFIPAGDLLKGRAIVICRSNSVATKQIGFGAFFIDFCEFNSPLTYIGFRIRDDCSKVFDARFPSKARPAGNRLPRGVR